MHLEIIDIKSLANILDVIKSVIETQDLVISTHPDYIQINQINPTRTAMISVNIGKECAYFDGFQCEDELIIVPMAGFQEALNTFNNFKRTVMELDRPNGVLKFLAKDGRKRKQTTLKLITEGEPSTEKVDLPYETIVKLNTIEFKNVIKDCASMGEFVVFKSSKTELRAITKGEMGSNEDTWLVGDNMDVLSAADTISAFPLNSLKELSAKADKISEKVTVSLLTGAPMTLVYDFAGGIIKVIVAPVLDEGVLNVE
jgi:hypothetical protein